jgi:MoxR-like ATPase
MSNKRVTVDEFGAAVKKMFGTLDVSKAQMDTVSATYNISIPSACKYAEKISESPVLRRIVVTEEVSAPDKVAEIILNPISPLTETELSEHQKAVAVTSIVAEAERTSAASLDSTISFIPKVDNAFVPWGNIGDIKKILKSRLFFPVYLTGMSGNGKTFGIEQTCAMLGREMIRVNFTTETDEDDLFGGFRLVNGETVFQYGPVIEAMKRGAVLLLDEIDLGSHKIMALQSVLEGKGYFIKKRAEWIEPVKGFTIIATANTKGKGSDDGRFIGTNVLNEAFLDRFSVTMYQPYPSEAIERKILIKAAQGFGIESESTDSFIPNLTMWGDIIRKTFDEGGVDEIVSTRRLVDILKSFSIFADRGKAIKMAIERFDDETRESFMSLYAKIDAGVGVEDEEKTSEEEGQEAAEKDNSAWSNE